MTPDRTPTVADVGTIDMRLLASFDGISPEGRRIRIQAYFTAPLPSAALDDLPVVARAAGVLQVAGGEALEYRGFGGGGYLPARHVVNRSSYSGFLPERAGVYTESIERYGHILPDEALLQVPQEHRGDGRRLTAHSHMVRSATGGHLRESSIVKSDKLIEECGDLVDLATIVPSVDELRAVAARVLIFSPYKRDGSPNGLHVRSPFPVWTFGHRWDDLVPQLTLPVDTDLNRGVTTFSHDRLDAARAYCELPSVRGRRGMGEPVGTVEVEAGWDATDDLSCIGRHLGRHWIRDVDPLVPRLSPQGVRSWHLGANADGLIRTEGRRGAEDVMRALLDLRDEVDRTPAFAAYAFFVNKTRQIADRLVHIEGMTQAPELHEKPSTR